VLRQDKRNAIADMRNAQRRKQPIQSLLATVLDVGNHLGGDLLSDSSLHDLLALLHFRFKVGDVIGFQLVEIGEGVNQPAPNQFIDQHVADPFDVHLTAPAKVAQARLHATRTSRVRAEHVDA